MPFNPEYRAQLASYDKHWVSKLVLRSILILIDLTTIGLVAWATATGLSRYDDNYYAWDSDVIPWDFIPLGASLIWCAVVVLILLLRKIPVHPGVEVGIDLILWLAFAILASFTILAAVELVDYQNSDSLDGSSSDSGYYTTAANGSSVYVTPNNTDDCPRFQSCTDQSGFQDSVRHRGIVEMTAGALMILALILHFTLFVWACVDTTTRNSKKVHNEAKEIAEAMIAEMVARGQLPPPQQPLLAPSHRGSQAVSETMSQRGNSATFMSGAGGYYAPQGYGPHSPGQMHTMPHTQPMMPPQSPLNTAQFPRSASPAFSPGVSAAPAPQRENSGEKSSQHGSGNGNGWHTPHTQPSEASGAGSNGYHAVSSDDPDAIRPVPPTRAPGHTYSPHGSISLENVHPALR